MSELTVAGSLKLLGPDSFNFGRQPAPLGITGMWWRFRGLFILQSYDKRLSEKGDGDFLKTLPVNAGGTSSIPGLKRCPGEGSCNPLQYSCLGNSMDRKAWWTRVHTVAKSLTWLSEHEKEGIDHFLILAITFFPLTFLRTWCTVSCKQILHRDRIP